VHYPEEALLDREIDVIDPIFMAGFMADQQKPSKTSANSVEAPGIEPGSGSSQPVRLRVVSRVLSHPACAHEQARTELAAQFLIPCTGRIAGDQPDRLRPPVSSGRLILRTVHACFLGSENKCVIVGTWIFHPGFTRSGGSSDTQHKSRSPRRSRSPPW